MMKVLFEALSFSADQHRGQPRKDVDKTAYIYHPIAVSVILAVEVGVEDEATIVAALLHDTVEDTGATFEDLTIRFGTEVADLVRELSDDKTLPKDVRKSLQITHAPHSSEKAKLIKIADKIANLRDLAVRPPLDWSAERIREYGIWASKVVAGCRGVNARLDDLFDQAVAKIL